jgi:hypothetical protein
MLDAQAVDFFFETRECAWRFPVWLTSGWAAISSGSPAHFIMTLLARGFEVGLRPLPATPPSPRWRPGADFVANCLPQIATPAQTRTHIIFVRLHHIVRRSYNFPSQKRKFSLIDKATRSSRPLQKGN